VVIASPWTFGWDALVAIGTIALAVGTIGLAFAAFLTAKRTRDLATDTERMADETRTLADLQRRAQQAAVKPTLMPAPGEPLEVAGDQTRLGLRLKNVGSGLALLHVARMLRTRGGEREDEYGGTFSVTVVPAGEEAVAVFRFPGQQQRFAEFTAGAFWIEATYTDAVEEQGETALFHVERVARLDNALHVVRVQLKRDGEEEPYASSGYGAIR
jgi:hypothetical protein